MRSDNTIQDRHNIYYIRILTAFICIGVLAAIVNYLYNRSLWTDEAMVSTNIINRNYAELLRPLDMNQVAPIGFLFIEKMFVNLFGNNDWALRIFPLLSYFLSIFIFYKLSYLLFNSSKLSATACCIFSLNVLLIYFSSEVKQYSSDVLMSLTIFYFTFYAEKIRNIKSIILLAAAGVVAIWISNIAIVILFVSSMYLLFARCIKQKCIDNTLFIPFIFWTITFIIYYSLFIYHHPSKEYMLEYWSNCGAFLPKNFLAVDFYKFIYFKIGLMFNYMFRFRTYWYLGLLFFILGLLNAIKTKSKIVLLIFPIVIHFCLSAIKLYPFDTRLILYQIPLVIIFFVKGLFMMYDFIDKRIIKIPVYIILLPAFLNIYSVIKQTPYQRQEVKKSLDYINSQIKEGQSIYVYRKGIAAFNFYANKYKNVQNSKIIYGTWKKTNMDSLNADVAKIHNNSWILFTNVYEMNEWSDEKYFIEKLKSSGFIIQYQRRFVGSSSYFITSTK